MKFLADESVDRQIVDRVRTEGHVVISVAEMLPGASDDTVLSLANREGAILLTADKDFGELIFRLGRVSLGVVLLRLAGLTAEEKAAITSSVIAEHAKDLPRCFAVIAPRVVRIRKGLLD